MKTKLAIFHSKSILLLAFILFVCSNNMASAQDSNQTESPYFYVFCEDTSVVDFPLISTNFNATISGVIANVELEQVYKNSGDSVIDATYVFPMSTNAAIYSMQMVVDNRVITAVIKEKQEAQNIFDDANNNGYTATLLEQHRPNVFQMNIANIKPGNTLKVRVQYTELLTPEKGVYQFVLPSIVGPRYTTNGEQWVEQSVSDSLDVAKTEMNVDLTINAGMPVFAECTSHDAPFSIDGTNASCHLKTNPGADFIVDYTLDGNEIKTGLLLYEGQDENFFLSIIQPPKPDVTFNSPSREYVFIMDVSGSMSGEPINVSKTLITDLLKDLNPNDKFNILFFAGGSSVLSGNSLPVTDKNIDKAISMIDEMKAGGGTELLPAMKRALTMEGTANYSRTFVILTDGYVTVEKEAYELIREHLNDANFFAFGIGRSVNRYIIEGIAYVGQGESFVVTNNQDAYEIADRFKEYIEHPALTNIQAKFKGINVYDVEPVSIPDVFAERPIIIYGKYDNASDGSITITGDYADGEISSTLNFANFSARSEENVALRYLWARQKIKLMSDFGIGSNENDNLSIQEEITQLGLKYSLITEYTSFVAVDSIVPVVSEEEDESVTAVDDYEDINNQKDADIIKIIGSNIRSTGILEIKLIGLEYYSLDDLILKIVDSNGNVLIKKDLSKMDLETVLSFDIDQFSNGLYHIVLYSGNQILDSEKFLIVK